MSKIIKLGEGYNIEFIFTIEDEKRTLPKPKTYRKVSNYPSGINKKLRDLWVEYNGDFKPEWIDQR
jgi:hypothetical protein